MQKEKPLRVMIDGTLFEGIDSFTLCPVYSVDDRLVSLPIQTFLPFLWYYLVKNNNNNIFNIIGKRWWFKKKARA